MENTRDSRCGKMFLEHSLLPAAMTSILSSANYGGGQAKSLAFLDLRNGVTRDASWVNIPQSLGEDWMLNFGESPKDASVSSLSQILEGNAPRKYFLSERACRGILERAERHHKKLHPTLKLALRNTIVWNTTLQTEDTDCKTETSYRLSPSEWVQGGAMSR